MKYLIIWLFKLLVYITLGAVAGLSLILLALFMWDERFMDTATSIYGYIWKKK